MIGRPKNAAPMPDRFWNKVLKTDGCWLWLASVFKGNGYGQFAVDGSKRDYAHRVAWTLVNGDPGDMWVLHRCDNRLCCNPAHLFLGTATDNNRDMAAKGRHVGTTGQTWHLVDGRRVFALAA